MWCHSRKELQKNGLNQLSTVSSVPFFIHFYSKANATEELAKTQKPGIEQLAESYANSTFYRETNTELDKLSRVQEEKSLAFKEITCVTSFCHQLRWIIWHSLKNLKAFPRVTLLQVTNQLFNSTAKY
jgi:hypothetical protein